MLERDPASRRFVIRRRPGRPAGKTWAPGGRYQNDTLRAVRDWTVSSHEARLVETGLESIDVH